VRERRDVYITDYIINVITALRLFASRDEPPRELANIPTGDNLEYWRQDMRLCARVHTLLRLFSGFLAFERQSSDVLNEDYVVRL